MSGFTSQLPSARTPPHGPLRRVLGQFIGQVMPVECSTHCPHIWQPKTGFLTAASMAVRRPMSAASRGVRLDTASEVFAAAVTDETSREAALDGGWLAPVLLDQLLRHPHRRRRVRRVA